MKDKQSKSRAPNTVYIRTVSSQVNLCQNLLFLHQLTHNAIWEHIVHWIMYKSNTWKFQAQTWGELVVNRNCFWHSEQFLNTTCSSHVLQKKSFWQRFTCSYSYVVILLCYIVWGRNKVYCAMCMLLCPNGPYTSLNRFSKVKKSGAKSLQS